MLKTFIRAATFFGVAAIPLLAVLGCGDENVSTVSGEVSFEGKPVEIGMVTFEPLEGGAPPRERYFEGGEVRGSSEGRAAPREVHRSHHGPRPGKIPFADKPGAQRSGPPHVSPPPPGWNVQSRLQVELKPGDNVVNFSGTRTQLPQVEVATP